MANVNILELLGRPIMDLQAISSAGPALANVAFLLAGGCPMKYVTSIRALYADNNLVCPNLDRVLKDHPLEDLNPESKVQHKHISLVDQLSVTEDESLQHLENSFEESPGTSSDKEEITINQEEYSETQQIKNMLKIMEYDSEDSTRNLHDKGDVCLIQEQYSEVFF